MTLDSRLRNLLEREFATITRARQHELRKALQRAEEHWVERNFSNSALRTEGIDDVLSDEYGARATAYLARALQRMSELGEPWTEARRTDVSQLLRARLQVDWNNLTEIREQLARDASISIGLLPDAKEIAEGEIDEELEMCVLRQERHRLPLADLLGTERYDAVRVAWAAARAPLERNPAAHDEAVRQAVGPVEALARLAADAPFRTLGDCPTKLRGQTDDAGRHLLSSIEKVYAFQTPSRAVGTVGPDDPPQPPEARYALGVAEASIRLLLGYDRA